MSNEKKEKKTLDFVNYFRNILGSHFYFYVIINFIVGLLDGIGLTMFVPLLGEATKTSTENYALGKLKIIPDLFELIGFHLDLSMVLLVMVVLFTLKAIASFYRDKYFNYLTLQSILKIRFDLSDQLEKLTYEGYTSTNPGKIQFALVSETQRIVRAMKQFMLTLQNFVILITFFILAFLTNWQFAILVACGGILSNIIYKKINTLTKTKAKELSQHGNTFNDILIQTIQNFKFLKATDLIYDYKKYLQKDIEKFENTQFKINNLNALAINLREPITILLISALMLIQIKVLGGNFATIMVSLLFFYKALSNLVSMLGNWNNFLTNAAGIDAIKELNYKFDNYQEFSVREIAQKSIHDIELSNISLNYGSYEVIKDVDLFIKDKSTIALIGESGAGKTTLANIICGLIAPTKGEVLYSGSLVTQRNIHCYRKKIGYIAQDPVIFSDTFYNNVTFWAPKTKENLDKFFHVIHLVHLDDFLNEFQDGMDTYLGSNGVLISGGQKQRITIARELFRDVNLLIMDEATSALDSQTEKIIKENIENLHGKFTIVLIAHRLSTVKSADKIYLLNKGEITSSGSFEDLYNKSNQFKKMVDIQGV